MNVLTPKQTVEQLDKYIIGQDEAKRTVAIALRNRYRRSRLPEEMREEIYPKNILMIGPTGVGKSEAALTIAKHLGSPVINADSRQIYAEIPIGTAAPTTRQQEEARHYFVGNHHVDDYYSASLYEEDCISLIGRLFCGNEDGTRHENLLLTGGSMMYIDAVCKGIDDIPTINDETRLWMKRRLDSEGLASLVEELRTVDPDYYSIVDKNNPRRVIHA